MPAPSGPERRSLAGRAADLCAALDRRILDGEPLSDLIAFAAEELVRSLALPGAWIGLLDGDGDVRPSAGAGSGVGPAGAADRWPEGDDGEAGPTARAVRTGRPVAVTASDRGAGGDGEERPAALLALPLRADGELLGALLLGDREPFDEDRIARLAPLADHLALAVCRHRAVDELRDRERRLRQMAESIGEVFYLRDVTVEEMLYLSPAYETIWGRPVETVYEQPEAWLEAIHPHDRPRVRATVFDEADPEFEIEYRIRRPDGEVRWIRDRSFAVLDDDGRMVRLAGVARDVTARKRTEEELRRQERRYRALFEDAGEAVLLVDLGGRIRDANEAFLEVSGYDRDDLEGVEAVDFYADSERRDELVERLRSEGRVVDFGARLQRKDGRYRHGLITASLVETGPGEVRIQATVRDVTEEVRHREELRHEALHDPLTGLPNRSLFRDRLGQALVRVGRSGGTAGLVYLDLNGFKEVNDRLGHSAGDRLLVEIGRRLAGAVRDSDTVARIGGDEFAVVLPSVGGRRGAAAVVDRLREALAPPFDLEGERVTQTAALGVALAAGEPAGGDPDGAASGTAPGPPDADTLLSRADRAMYGAKQRDGTAAAFAEDEEEGAAGEA